MKLGADAKYFSSRTALKSILSKTTFDKVDKMEGKASSYFKMKPEQALISFLLADVYAELGDGAKSEFFNRKGIDKLDQFQSSLAYARHQELELGDIESALSSYENLVRQYPVQARQKFLHRKVAQLKRAHWDLALSAKRQITKNMGVLNPLRRMLQLNSGSSIIQNLVDQTAEELVREPSAASESEPF